MPNAPSVASNTQKSDPEKDSTYQIKVVDGSDQELDVAAQLAHGGESAVISEAESTRLRKKIDRNLIPMMCLLYLMQFADKTVLGQSAVLGLISSTHLTVNQFNWLGTVFYLSYLVFEYPQNLALQYFPAGKWMSLNIFVWSVALCASAACKDFSGLLVTRIILGMCEGAITAGFLLVTTMFYTRSEQVLRVGYWFIMNGLAAIILGFISFGLLHTKTEHFKPWQWLAIIAGIITLIVFVIFWFFFPDSPSNARFLNSEERRQAVLRLKSNQTGVKNKRFKRYQLFEALYDPKTWLFSLTVAICQIPNSIINQRQLIVKAFGFSPIYTTLIGCVDGVVVIFAIYSATKISSAIRNCRGIVAALWSCTLIIGGILVITLSSHNKIGLLFSYWTALCANGVLPVLLSWLNSVTAGCSKRVTTNAIVLIFYSIGNAAGPFMWKAQYQPRNRIPWAIMIGANGIVAILCMTIYFYLRYENRERNRTSNEKDLHLEDTYIIVTDGAGAITKQKVDRAFLDLTDRENRDFRYVL